MHIISILYVVVVVGAGGCIHSHTYLKFQYIHYDATLTFVGILLGHFVTKWIHTYMNVCNPVSTRIPLLI